jgi:hypothetical protein
VLVSDMAKGNYPYAAVLLAHPSLGPLLYQALDGIPRLPGSANPAHHPLPKTQTLHLKNALRELKTRKRDLGIVRQDKIARTIPNGKTVLPRASDLAQAEKNREENTRRTNIIDFTEEEFEIASERLRARLFTLVNADRYGGAAAAQLMGLANGKTIDGQLSQPRPLSQDPETSVNDLLLDIQSRGGIREPSGLAQNQSGEQLGPEYGSYQECIDSMRCQAALADSPDDQGLAAADVASGVELGDVGGIAAGALSRGVGISSGVFQDPKAVQDAGHRADEPHS